ncbi:unnamed protein product [Albugo candida]|uniref:Uncharacterized protein n=1 Tax=Albugo candida TaxID=65357 RepID=A0A024FX78_9STRA|nr:unnamed protein product [Albugo candida]|eukprot:CCI11626.1 unnamed protein product [Albugo candida]
MTLHTMLVAERNIGYIADALKKALMHIRTSFTFDITECVLKQSNDDDGGLAKYRPHQSVYGRRNEQCDEIVDDSKMTWLYYNMIFLEQLVMGWDLCRCVRFPLSTSRERLKKPHIESEVGVSRFFLPKAAFIYVINAKNMKVFSESRVFTQTISKVCGGHRICVDL